VRYSVNVSNSQKVGAVPASKRKESADDVTEASTNDVDVLSLVTAKTVEEALAEGKPAVAARLLSEQEVARLFSLTTRALRAQRERSELPGSLALRIGNRFRYQQSDLIAYWQSVLDEAAARHAQNAQNSNGKK
jgi:hypothetical protein